MNASYKSILRHVLLIPETATISFSLVWSDGDSLGRENPFLNCFTCFTLRVKCSIYCVLIFLILTCSKPVKEKNFCGTNLGKQATKGVAAVELNKM